jgi:hypothetical protein
MDVIGSGSLIASTISSPGCTARATTEIDSDGLNAAIDIAQTAATTAKRIVDESADLKVGATYEPNREPGTGNPEP